MKTTWTDEEALDLIIEEAAEVIQAACKCKRFGLNHIEPGYGHNAEVLAKELGDLDGARQMIRWKYDQLVSYSWASSTKLDRFLEAREKRTQDTVPLV